jgi:tripartite motif-containing protein 71
VREGSGLERPRRILFALATAVLVLASSVSLGSQAASAVTTPLFLGNLPSPGVDGHAGVYAWGAATLPDGSVIIGDYWNGRVLHYAKDGADLGVLFSIVQPGKPVTSNTAPYGLAVDETTGVVYVGTYYIDPKIPSVVQRWAPDAITGVYQQQTPISYSGFLYPSRVAVANDGRVYVADMNANKIFVFNSAGSFLFSWGSFGTGNGQFKQPRGLAFDQSNPQRLYVADANNVRVQVFNTSGVYQFQFKSHLKGNLRGLAVDPARDAVYVVSITGQAVFKYNLSGVWLMNIGSAGGLSQTTCCSTPSGQFSNGGREITVAGDGNIWVGDMPNFRVQVFSPAGQFQFSRPSPAENPPAGGFNAPRGVEVDGSGNVVVADSYNQRIEKFDASGSWVWSIGVRGNATGYFLNYPGAVATDPGDGSVVIADTANSRIKKFTANGVFVWQQGAGTGGDGETYNQPAGVAVGQDGTVYVADTRNKRIQVLDGATGVLQSTFGTSNLTTPNGLTVDPATGNIFVADSGRKAVQVFTAGGSFARSITATAMKRPYDVAVDDTSVYVTDRGQNKFFMFTKATGALVGSFGALGSGNGQFQDPQGIGFGDGELFISDVKNDRIQVWCVSSSCGA